MKKTDLGMSMLPSGAFCLLMSTGLSLYHPISAGEASDTSFHLEEPPASSDLYEGAFHACEDILSTVISSERARDDPKQSGINRFVSTLFSFRSL